MSVGIVGYGAYVPRYRIKTEEIARVWGIDGVALAKRLNLYSKSVPAPDEDVATIATTAARYSVKRAKIDPQKIGALYVGSESHPYAVKPTATIVAEAINATPELTAADFEFACKAGTAAMQSCMGLVNSGHTDYAMAIGADTSQGAPGDPLEYSASAGGAAMLIGKEKILAEINETVSYTTDTPDFWRREGQKYPRHAERFTGAPAYFKHITSSAKMLMEKIDTKPEDYDFVILHQPNGKFPLAVAKMLGVRKEKVLPGLLTPRIGNTYSGASLLGLAAVLDGAEPGDRIMMISYGSGAGSDAFDITVTERIVKARAVLGVPHVEDMIAKEEYIDYATYAKFREKIVFQEDTYLG